MSGGFRGGKGRTVTIIGIDPGSTTGLCVATVDSAWIAGQVRHGSWETFGAAVRTKVAYQIGRQPRAFFTDADRATRLDSSSLDEHLLPVLAGQPLMYDDGGRKVSGFYDILNGKGVAGGDDLLLAEAQELVQVRQVAGLLDNYPDAAVVIEDFMLRSDVRSRELLSPDRLRLAITAEEILHGSGRVPFTQTPALAKTTVTDSRLKAAGLWFSGMEHARDAARHVAAFARACRGSEDLRAAAFPRNFRAEFDLDEGLA